MLKTPCAVIVAAGVLVSGVPASAAPADAPPIVDKTDRHGDVKVHGPATDLDPAVIDSIDLRHVTVTRQPHGVRVVVRLKKVLPPRGRFFQLVGISLFEPGAPTWVGSAPGSIFLALATPQHLGSSQAFYVDDVLPDGPDGEEDGVKPLICHLYASKGGKVVSIVVPDRCLPPDAGKLVVSSALIDKRSDAAELLIIEDTLTVGGQIDLRP